MKTVMFEIEPWESERLDHLRRDERELRFVHEELGPDNVEDYGDAQIISTFIYSDLGRKVLEKLPDLRMITTRSTGFDHIDMDYARERGITVCNVPEYGDETVAEHVFALLLAISHRMIEAVDRTRRGDFSPRGLTGFDLCGKTFGVVGTGRIGSRAAAIARGFEMKVIAYDVAPDEALARDLGFRYVSLQELLESSDVVSIHVPGSRKTRHLFSEEEFQRMKPGSVLINTSRGPVVHVQPLLRALGEGRLAGAGLDVLPEEPVIREEAELLRSVFNQEHDLSTLLADQVLLRLKNVVITPHSAFNTKEAVQRILDTTCENLEAFYRGEPINVVDDQAAD